MSSKDRTERIVARLRLAEDGSLSNPKAELYALTLADGVVSKTAAQQMCFQSEGGNLPSSQYLGKIQESPHFKIRVAELQKEKAELADSEDLRKQMLWQVRQLWRRGCALGDARLMERATALLFDLDKRVNPPPKPEKAPEEENPRGRGAPAVETPTEEGYTPGTAARDRLLTR